MTTFEKLALKIEKDTGLKVSNLKRTYHGKTQRSAGAFIWVGDIDGGFQNIGSTYTATELTKCGKLDYTCDSTTSEIWPDK